MGKQIKSVQWDIVEESPLEVPEVDEKSWKFLVGQKLTTVAKKLIRLRTIFSESTLLLSFQEDMFVPN